MTQPELFEAFKDKLRTTFLGRKKFCIKYKINYSSLNSSLNYRKRLNPKEARAIADFMGIDPVEVLQFTNYADQYAWDFSSGCLKRR